MNNNPLYHALNNLVSIDADYTKSYDLIVENESDLNKATINDLTVVNNITMPPNFIIRSIINQPPTLIGTNQFVNSNFQENIYQSGGSSQFKDCLIGTITQNGISTIIQSGTQWNYLKSTQITNLEVLGTLTIPSGVTIPGATYNSDLSLINNSTIQQQTTVNINTLSGTDFFGNIRCNYNLVQVGGSSTYALLKNLTVEGNSTLGPITSPTITLINTNITNLQNNKLDKNNGVATSLTISGNANLLNGRVYCSENSGLFYYLASNGISNPSCSILIASYNAMITDLYSSTDMRYRFVINGTTTIQHQFNSNGSVMFKGVIDSPTITTINSQIANLITQDTNLQNQINLKSNITNPTFAGTATLPTTYNNQFMYFRNVGPTLPTISSQSFGAISTNYQNGHADVDFWNCYGDSNASTSAFRFYNINANGSPFMLLNLMRNGDTFCYGKFSGSGGLILPIGQIFSILGNISVNSLTITPIVLSRISNLSSDCQDQINNLQNQINTLPNLTPLNNIWTGTNKFSNTTTFDSNININSNIVVNSVSISTVELSYIDGLTSSIQTQLNGLQTQITNLPPPSSLLSSSNIWTNSNTFSSSVNFSSTVSGLNKSMVGLNLVDNTADIDKVVSNPVTTQLNLKAPIINPSFNGIVSLPVVMNNNMHYFKNIGTLAPTIQGGVFGAISTNFTGGHAELDFWNNYADATSDNSNTSAFRFYNRNSNGSNILLLNILRNLNIVCYGTFLTVNTTLTGLLSGVNATFTNLITTVNLTCTGIFTAVGATFTNTINGTNAIFSSTIQSVGATVTGLITSDSLITNSITTQTISISNAISGDLTVSNNITSQQGIISGRNFRGLTSLQTAPFGVRYKWFDNSGTASNLPNTIVLNQNTSSSFIVYLPDPNMSPDLPIDGARSREGISVKIYFWVARSCQIYDGSNNSSDLHLPGTDSNVYNINGSKSQCIEFMVLRPNTSSVLQWCLLN